MDGKKQYPFLVNYYVERLECSPRAKRVLLLGQQLWRALIALTSQRAKGVMHRMCWFMVTVFRYGLLLLSQVHSLEIR